MKTFIKWLFGIEDSSCGNSVLVWDASKNTWVYRKWREVRPGDRIAFNRNGQLYSDEVVSNDPWSDEYEKRDRWIAEWKAIPKE